MSSHLIHKDADGVGMVWERYRRDPERQAAVKLGHSARIISDISTYAKLRLTYLLLACNQSRNSLSEIEKKYNVSLFEELAEASRNFAHTEYGSKN